MMIASGPVDGDGGSEVATNGANFAPVRLPNAKEPEDVVNAEGMEVPGVVRREYTRFSKDPLPTWPYWQDAWSTRRSPRRPWRPSCTSGRTSSVRQERSRQGGLLECQTGMLGSNAIVVATFCEIPGCPLHTCGFVHVEEVRLQPAFNR